MKWAIVVVLACLMLGSGVALAQTIENADEVQKSNEQTLGNTQYVDNSVGGEVIAERKPDRATWNGISARALVPAIQGGDIVGRTKAMFTSSAFYSDAYILMTTCEAQFGPDRCWFTWKVWPSRTEQIGVYYEYSARDKDNCWRINQTKKFYTRSEFYDGNGQPGPVIESDNSKYERACGNG